MPSNFRNDKLKASQQNWNKCHLLEIEIKQKQKKNGSEIAKNIFIKKQIQIDNIIYY